MRTSTAGNSAYPRLALQCIEGLTTELTAPNFTTNRDELKRMLNGSFLRLRPRTTHRSTLIAATEVSVCRILRRISWTGRWRNPTLATVVREILISDLAYDFVRPLLYVSGSRSHTVVSGNVPLNVDLSVSLCSVDASNTSSGRQRARAAGDRNTAAAEAELASLSIDQHNVAGIALVLQAETEFRNRERTRANIARAISSGAGNSGRAHRKN